MPVLKIKKNGVWEELGGAGPANGGDADTLGGILAKDYATKDDLNVKSQVQIITWEADD